MKTLIISRVPTVCQLKSISSFGMGVKRHGDGSFSAQQEFRTKKMAIRYLIERAEYLAESSRELREMKRDINKHGMLSYDAAIASIIKKSEQL